MSTHVNLKKLAQMAKNATHEMARASTDQKNEALRLIAQNLKKHQNEILKANEIDIASGRVAGLDESLIDRLTLRGRLEGIIADIDQVIKLQDPIGEVFEKQTLENGLKISKSRTPIGVLGVIYESRPNVTVDVTTLTIKSGNCAILRGGSETLHTNECLIKIIHDSLKEANLPVGAIQFIQSSDRSLVKKLLHLHDYVDLIIPRGGASLHRFCRENSSIPVITGGIGICHLFVDETAELKPSLDVVVNAKVQRPTVCNALDTLLVHEKVAMEFIPLAIETLRKKGVRMRLDNAAWKILDKENDESCTRAGPNDWDTEWLSLVLGIKVVKNIDEAIKHIIEHSTGHSDGILTQTKKNGIRFVKEIDSAAVYVNASTRFTDGGQLGLGAEVAISTQKLHARGPMGLRELTSYKWVIHGDYSVRK